MKACSDYILSKTGTSAGFKIAVVSDRIVSGYYYNRFEEQFLKKGIKPVLIPVECADGAKELKDVSAVYDYLTDFGFGSSDWLISLGGGGILDVTAFCASVFEGGINFLAVPTTPDSMCEGACASKAFLNSKKLKNAVSTAFNPNAVIIDPAFLETVPSKIMCNGYADIIKLGLLGDLSILTSLAHIDNYREFLNRVYSLRDRISSVSPELLTLGSELSYAIEGYFRFMNYSEGQAMALSLLSCADERAREPLKTIYEALAIPVKLEGVSHSSIMKILHSNLMRLGSKKLRIVDMTDETPRRWTVKTVTVGQAEEIMTGRLSVILSD